MKYDEGLVAYGALRILHGDVPYRDFFSSYMPACFYFLAFVFKVFGTTLLNERIWSIVGQLLMTSMVFFIGRTLYSELLAILAWLIAVVWVGYTRIWGYPIPWAVFFSLASILFFLRFLNDKKNRTLFLAGVFNGIATTFRQDLGFYAFLTELVVLVLFMMTNLKNEEKSYHKKTFFSVLTYCLGTGAVLLPVFIYFLKVVGWRDLEFNLITYALKIYPKVRNLPFPLFSWVHGLGLASIVLNYLNLIFIFYVYFPILVFVTTSMMLLSKIRQDAFCFKNQSLWAVFTILFLGVTFFNGARIRVDSVHVIPMMIPAIILFFWMINQFLIHKKKLALRLSVLLLVFFSFFPILRKIFYDGFLFKDDYKYAMTIDRGKGINHRDSNYENVIKYVQSKVPLNERIFVGNLEMDRIVLNDVLFYFLADRHSATKYHELLPGLATEENIQKTIIGEIKKNNVHYLVLWNYYKKEPNESRKKGSKILDRYIRNNFVLDKQFDDYTVLRRNNRNDRSNSFVNVNYYSQF